ncbi:MAG: hypothetical protein PVI59_14370, partial [Anaerolineae bacterium]
PPQRLQEDDSPPRRDLTAGGLVASFPHQDGPPVLVTASVCPKTRGVLYSTTSLKTQRFYES